MNSSCQLQLLPHHHIWRLKLVNYSFSQSFNNAYRRHKWSHWQILKNGCFLLKTIQYFPKIKTGRDRGWRKELVIRTTLLRRNVSDESTVRKDQYGNPSHSVTFLVAFTNSSSQQSKTYFFEGREGSGQCGRWLMGYHVLSALRPQRIRPISGSLWSTAKFHHLNKCNVNQTKEDYSQA